MAQNLIRIEREELEQFVQEYLELESRGQRPEGIYSILPGSREAKYQSTLQYFLDPQKSHGFGYTLLEQFLECVDFYEFNLPGQHIEIKDEVPITDEGVDGRVDLIIAGGSALDDHPQWAVFLELKVGASEGAGQTPKYARADTWNVNWFGGNEIAVDDLDSRKYVYLKKALADSPADKTFESVGWTDVLERFEAQTGDSLFECPNRSVVQFTDFIQSLKETEGMDSSIDEDELNERLTLYFDHRDLIQQIQKANSQFESDFEDVSTYLTANWEDKVATKYDFETSGWETSAQGNAEYQKIFPAYWNQDPLNSRSKIQVFYRHSPTTDLLRKQTLRFRLRLPPARNVHTNTYEGDNPFNELFTEKCTTNFAGDI